MGFRLVIVEGKGVGRDFYFSQNSVKVGRAPDNDLVLYDVGVSRYHLELVGNKKGNAYTLRDLGSANGVLLNGSPATEAVVSIGDTIALGPVTFQFEIAKSANEPSGISSVRHGEMFRPENTVVRRVLEEEKTSAYQPPNLQLGQKPQLPQLPRKSQLPRQRTERARTHTGSFVQFSKRRWAVWLKAQPGSTRIAVAAAVLVVVAGVVGAIYVGTHRPQQDRSGEIFAANTVNSGMRFGSGKVDFFTPDRVNFSFEYQGGKATLFFAAGGVESGKELEILVNNEHVGYSELALGGWTQGLSQSLPRKLLKPGINIVTFDNTLTPNLPERWGVWQVKVVQQDLPRADEDKAQDLYGLGVVSFDARSVLPENLHRSIEYFKEAALYLEELELPPPLLDEIVTAQSRAEEELQKICDTYMFASEKALRFGDRAEAVQSLRDLLRYLPDVDDPRREKAKNKLTDLVGQGVP
ncbi:MAG: hypothetical protein A2289_18600 [Deltaproteobacteria bacterium RIFOXYA12_FULL_58_15]|nr:MAG: hypothetical protein A2289_18600 [Deltaproteobacteria bacterium RIFOXYA12_FULL_58_15]OGR12843.1 MAG: hypothetical protein A2341_21955 [Deltaproteobacteria bacterium RIFOXYB12_FULL_58_9]